MNWNILLGSLRTKRNLTQQEMANILHCTLRSYQLYESGSRLISIEKINLLSNYFHVSIDYLLGITKKSQSFNKIDSFNYLRLTFYLKFLRIKEHITQKDLARFLKVSAHTVSRYEINAKNINILYLAKVANYFNISVDYMGGKTTKKEVL